MANRARWQFPFSFLTFEPMKENRLNVFALGVALVVVASAAGADAPRRSGYTTCAIARYCLGPDGWTPPPPGSVKPPEKSRPSAPAHRSLLYRLPQ